MHELSVAALLADLVTSTAAENGVGQVASARLLLGALTCVDPETLRFAFDVCLRGTAAEGCRLDVVRTPLRLRCRQCGIEGGEDPHLPCAACGALGYDVLSGREIRLESIEMEAS